MARQLFCTVLLMILGLPGVVIAQEQTSSAPGVQITDGGNRVIYTADYFSEYNVVNARDQILRIPGAQDLLSGGGGQDRGFGSGGEQILINGSRISGKSNDVDSVLERIQARQVLQIEVIRGSVPGLDVRSQGRVVNVVLAETSDTGYGSASLGLDRSSGGKLALETTANYSGELGKMHYLFSVEAGSRDRIERSLDSFYTATGELFELENEESVSETDQYTLSTNTSYTFANRSALNLNAFYEREKGLTNEISNGFIFVDGEGIYDGGRLRADDEPETSWEIGGDYAYVFTNGNTLTTRFIYSYSDEQEEGSFYRFATIGGEPLIGDIQAEESLSIEKILRSSYDWDLGEKHQFESGLEIAINTVEEDATLFEENGGILVEVLLFNQQSEIEEIRYEAFNSYSWQSSDQLLIETSLDLEYSEIAQQGNDITRTRDFVYPKPRMVLSYDHSEQVQIRGRIERTIDQLDFGDFVASFIDDDNRSDVIRAGNPDLEPEKAWEYELTFERQLLDDRGVFSVSAMYQDISDHTGRIPLLIATESGTAIRTASGSLGDGYRAQLEFTGSLRLDSLNIRGGVIDLTLELQDTQATDPFTGEKREIDNADKYEWNLAYRQDVNWKGLSFGFEARGESASEKYDLDYEETHDEGIALEFFAELQLFDNIRLRFDAENLLNKVENRERYQYFGARANGFLARREERSSYEGREFGLTVNWVF